MPRARARPAEPALLAKFSRPRLYNVVKRERLFARIDDARDHPLVWIAGPPGAGKTTLVGSYVVSRKLTGIWFQADGGDADPGTLFHYLTLAAAELAAARPAGSANPAPPRCLRGRGGRRGGERGPPSDPRGRRIPRPCGR